MNYSTLQVETVEIIYIVCMYKYHDFCENFVKTIDLLFACMYIPIQFFSEPRGKVFLYFPSSRGQVWKYTPAGVYFHEIFVKFSRRYEIPSRGGVFYSKNHTYPVEIDFTKNHILAIFELHRNALPTQSGGEV